MALQGQEKVIVITGAASGIGLSAARKFFNEGYALALCDLSAEKLNQAVKELKEQGGSRVFTACCNIAEKAETERFAAEVFANFGRIDALFANAGIHRSNTLLNVEEEELSFMIDVNIKGTIFTMQSVLPFIIKSGGGSVVLNASEQCFIGKKNNFVYGLTKGALGQAVKSASAELAQYNIRVNAVCPSTVRTPLAEDAIRRWALRDGMSVEEAWAEESSIFTCKRVGEAEEVAELVFFLTEKGTFCNGALYLADGGLTAQ